MYFKGFFVGQEGQITTLQKISEKTDGAKFNHTIVKPHCLNPRYSRTPCISMLGMPTMYSVVEAIDKMHIRNSISRAMLNQ